MTVSLFFHDFFRVAHIPPQYWYIDVLRSLIRVLIPLFGILLPVPILVWWERRLLGWMQMRQGPNRVGPYGLLQTIADGIKLLFKEDMNPAKVDKFLFVIAPIVFLIPTLVVVGVIPWHPSLIWGAGAPMAGAGVLYILLWASLAVYGIVLAGWSSNNKYSLLGGLRSSAQMISYELGMGLVIITVALLSGSIWLHDIVENQGYNPNMLGIAEWNVGKFFPMGFMVTLIYMISMLAETNRAPFDLPEAETELVAGYHTEYTSMKFATFFMGEYGNMVVTSAVLATLFFGGYKAPIQILDGPYLGHFLAEHGMRVFGGLVSALVPPFWLILKIIGGLYFFIWVRASWPRLRYDMLMRFGWQGILPIALANIVLVACAITAYGQAGNIGWLGVAVLWFVIAGVWLAFYAGTKRVTLFAANVERGRSIRLHSDAVPYRTDFDHPGRGGQTLPPDAKIDGAIPAVPEPITAKTAVKSKKG